MTFLPDIIDPPIEVPETTVWPELSRELGQDGHGIGSGDRRWLTIATTHRSALYENRELSTVVSPNCLSLLEGVGTAVLDLELRMLIDRSEPQLDVKQRNLEIAGLIGPVRRVLVERLVIAENARLGSGERQQIASGHATRSVETVLCQVLGWWSLRRAGREIRNLLQRIHGDVVAVNNTSQDLRTILDQHFGKLSPHFTYTREGPDHATTFWVTVTTTDGRSGKGSAASKKVAARQACRDYLAAHAPRLLERQPTVSQPPPLSSLPVHTEHRRLAERFGVSDARLFSRALTHKSWVYENTRHRDRRASNEVLANLGSAVLGVLSARTRAAHLMSETLWPDPDMSIRLTIPDEELVPVGYALHLPAACRLGAGQRSAGVSKEMAADLVQAVLAAAYLQAADLHEFEDRLPAVVARSLVVITGRLVHDPVTRLEQLISDLDLELSLSDRRTGPDHGSTYHNTIRICSNTATVVVEGSASSRTGAKKAAAAKAIEAAELCTQATDTSPHADLARFFLTRQLEVLGTKPNRWPRWWQNNVLGARLVADRDWATFGRWVNAVESIGRLDLSTREAPRDILATYYQRAASAEARPMFTATLARVLNWVASSADDDQVILDQERWDELVALTAAHSIVQSNDDTRDLKVVLDSLARPDRRHDPVNVELTGAGDAKVGGQAGAAVQRILQELRPGKATSGSVPHATVVPGLPAHEIRLSPAAVWSPGSPATVDLVCEAAPEATVYRRDQDVVLRVAAREVIASGWLWDAALSTSGADEHDEAFARLLHDLKNQVTGARSALRRPTTTRTEKLHADFEASRHTDNARAIATQLRDAAMLYDTAQAGSCDLGSFLRAYSSELINQLPAGIRVVAPATTSTPVAVSSEVLRSVLDNLVKNAVEAMGGSGQLALEYTTVESEDAVLLEVRDSGPGVPDDVLSALETGTSAPSSKRHGSGLGLYGVIRLVRRAGGNLHPLRPTTGAAWLLTLPTANEGDATK